jgi:hypothetical protein
MRCAQGKCKASVRAEVRESTGLTARAECVEAPGKGENARMQGVAPNPSIERTAYSWLRQLPAAAHVER